MTLKTARIGLVGLGNMGGRIGQHLVSRGVDVLGFDTVIGRAMELGLKQAVSLADLTSQMPIILMSLPDTATVEAVMNGPDGLGEHLVAGQIVVDLSTVSPAATRRISASLAERGVHYLDAGVSGGAAAAERGALTLMVGGMEDVLQEIRPVLDKMAAAVYFCGSSGAGHTVKLLNNFLNAVTLSATAEVMVAAKRAELDLSVVLDVINSSSGVSFASTNRFPHIIKGDYLEGGLSNTLMLKDVNLYVELLSTLGAVSLNAAGPMAAFGAARALGYADRISNTVVDAIGDLSGGVRLVDGK
jgi:3-hydroxyisobutyrate dehydrogenase